MPILDFVLAAFAAFLIGFSKSGMKGIGVFIVTITAIVFGGKTSTGILLPLLIVGDILALFYYRKLALWKHIFRLLPMMVLGITAGALAGKNLPEEVFKNVLASIIILSTLYLLYRDKKKNKHIPTSPLFGYGMGLGAGVTTMMGNLAGAFSNIYFMSMRLPKEYFIGTSTVLFFIINLIKLPFHILLWNTINQTSIEIDLYILPFVLAGFFSGIRIVKKINEANYRKFILIMTIIGSLVLLFK